MDCSGDVQATRERPGSGGLRNSGRGGNREKTHYNCCECECRNLTGPFSTPLNHVRLLSAVSRGATTFAPDDEVFLRRCDLNTKHLRVCHGIVRNLHIINFPCEFCQSGVSHLVEDRVLAEVNHVAKVLVQIEPEEELFDLLSTKCEALSEFVS
jgi:hypothetical protein